MSIPSNLNIVFRSLQGYRKNLIRFYPDRSGVINSGDVLRYTFPKEVMTLDTLMKYFEFTSTASQSGTSQRQGTFFPRNSFSIIDTLTVFINGQVYENIVSYNHLANVITDNCSGYNYYCSGLRQLECTDPSVSYTLNATTEAITSSIKGASNTGTTDAQVCDTKRPIQIRNWLGFLSTGFNDNSKSKIIDLTNVELVVEIRLASPNIMWKGIDCTASPVSLTPNYSIDNYYMTIQKITFDDDTYQRALNSLKASGNYTLVFKTYSTARSGSISKSSQPTLQFSTTAKYLSKLYLTCMDKDYDSITYLLNQGQTSTAAKSFTTLMADTQTNIIAFNQSRYFQKNSSGLKEAQVEINGIMVYPFPQPVHLIKNNNFDALEQENDRNAADYPGLQSLETWSKYGFLQAVSFEHRDAWAKEQLITGYPNPNGNLLTIKWSPTFDTGNSNNTILLAFAERVVMAKFNGNAVSIEY